MIFRRKWKEVWYVYGWLVKATELTPVLGTLTDLVSIYPYCVRRDIPMVITPRPMGRGNECF
jgi:hypothetical protein